MTAMSNHTDTPERCLEMLGPFQCELRQGHTGRCRFDEHEQLGRNLIHRWEVFSSPEYPGMFELNGIDGELHRYYLSATPCGRICLRRLDGLCREARTTEEAGK